MTTAGPDAPRRFLALGDSYTVGEGVPPEGRWPQQLVAALRAAGRPLADPDVRARTGWTCADLAASLDAEPPAGPYALVTLCIGVNDQYDGAPADAYRASFRGLLERAMRCAGGEAGRVVVVAVPDWGPTPRARDEGRDPERVAAEIDAYNAVNRAEADAAGAGYADVVPASRRPPEPAYVADGLHPSARQYARWLDVLVPAAQRALVR